MKELITVVVPIYNVEKYLDKCIQSIINQTYRNLEIILVDDGSKDSSFMICDKYQTEDDRIQVIHKENGGLSDARNIGIDIAHGQYIMFIDSDDFIDLKMIEILYENLKQTDSDISLCGVNIVKNNKIKKNNKENKLEVFSRKQAYQNLYNYRALETVVAWNKLYKIKIFDDIRYPKGKINEDAFIIHKLLEKIDKIVYTPQKLYFYIKRKGSITGNFNLKRLDELDAFEQRIQFFKEKNMQELYEKSLYRYCASNRYCYIHVKDEKIKNKLDLEFIKKYNILKKSQYLSQKEKIKLYVLKNGLFIYKIRKILEG